MPSSAALHFHIARQRTSIYGSSGDSNSLEDSQKSCGEFSAEVPAVIPAVANNLRQLTVHKTVNPIQLTVRKTFNPRQLTVRKTVNPIQLTVRETVNPRQ